MTQISTQVQRLTAFCSFYMVDKWLQMWADAAPVEAGINTNLDKVIKKMWIQSFGKSITGHDSL